MCYRLCIMNHDQEKIQSFRVLNGTEAEARLHFGDALVGPVPGSAKERREPSQENIKANSTGIVARDPD